MPSNRFAVAIHILTLLARHGGTMTSEELAGSVNTNPVVIRRILGRLRDAGLVCAVSGPNGGSKLCVDTRKVSLLDIYRVVEQTELIGVHEEPNQRCPIGRRIQAVLHGVTTDVKHAVEQELKATTLSEIVQEFNA